MDTNSIMYYDHGKNTVQTSPLLGCWTDELDGSYIQSMLASAPKTHSYKTASNNICTKMKGFTLHHKNAEKLNATALEELIDGAVRKIKVTNTQIIRNKTTKQLVNKDETKTLSFKFEKRIMLDNYDTVPYGYLY